MLFGVMASAVTAVITVLTSGSKALKADLRWKLVGFYRIRPRSILAAVIGFMTIVAVSILLSLLFGKSLRKAAGVDTGEDSVAFHFSWFCGVGYLWLCMGIMASSLFWYSGYIPLRTKGIGCFYVLNFLISVSPMGFLTTWVYVKNNCSMLCLHHFSLVCEYHAGKNSLDAADKMRGNDCDILCGGFYCVLTTKEMF